MSLVYISLGSNVGDRFDHLANALDLLQPFARILKKSAIYETAPWGYLDQPSFLNQVILAETSCSPRKLLRILKRIEKKIGRKKTFRFGPRVIDLDILFYDDIVLNTKKLVIPHPSLPERAFVLVPMAEIAPDFVHPVLAKPILDLLENVDTAGVKQL